MVLRVDGSLLILTDIGPNNDEDLFVQLNPDFIKVTSLPYSESGIYRYADDGVSIIPDEASELEALKRLKMDEIYNKFTDMMHNGTFMSSLGFEADNRRGNDKNDKDNVQSLIDLGQEPVYFRDAKGDFHQLSIEDLIKLKQEMIQDGLSKYQWKWTKEREVMTAATIEELNSILID